MPTRLILNADDFGLTPGVNRAIAELHRAGALTSATLMATGAAFEDAIALAHQNPALGVGCHIVLTDGTPVLPPASIPTLIGPDGKTFRPSLNGFYAAALTGRIDPHHVELEAVAQIERLQQHGIRVTHLDTHKHTHILPPIARAVLRAAARCNVPAIRNPFEQPWSLAIGRTVATRRLQVALLARLRPYFLRLPQIASGTVRTTEGTLGISATGRLDEIILRETLAAMPEGTWELVCHPGYNDRDLDAVTTRLRQTREVERAALLQVFSAMPDGVAELISFAGL